MTPWPPSDNFTLGPDYDPPDGWNKYLAKHAGGEWLKGNDPWVLSLDDKMWRLLQSVNREANAFQYQAEVVDDWDHILPGDCENITLFKRLVIWRDIRLPVRLERIMGALRPTLLMSPSISIGRPMGEAHMVLSVVTDQGTYILDNLVPMIMPWRAYPAQKWLWIWNGAAKWAAILNDADDGAGTVEDQPQGS